MESFIRLWDSSEKKIIGILLGISTFIAFMEIVSREIFSFSFYWAEEVVIYLIIWATFIGASTVLKKNQHIRVNFFIRLFSPPKQKMIDLAVNGIGLIFCLFLLVSGLKLVIDAQGTMVTSISLLQTPMYLPYLSIPLGATLLSIRFIERIYNLFKDPKG